MDAAEAEGLRGSLKAAVATLERDFEVALQAGERPTVIIGLAVGEAVMTNAFGGQPFLAIGVLSSMLAQLQAAFVAGNSVVHHKTGEPRVDVPLDLYRRSLKIQREDAPGV